MCLLFLRALRTLVGWMNWRVVTAMLKNYVGEVNFDDWFTFLRIIHALTMMMI